MADDTAEGELMHHLRAAVMLMRDDAECRAALLRDGELLHTVRDQVNVLYLTVHRLGLQAPGRVREGGE